KGLRFRPLLFGGPPAPARPAGPESVPGIVGMGLAAELARRALPEMPARVAAMRDRLERGIVESIDDAHVIGAGADARLPNTTNIGFARLEAEAILMLLREQGVCAS